MENGKSKKVNTRQRGKTWSYYFDTAKIDGKRKKVEKGGFDSENSAYLAGIKAYDEYNNSGEVFKPSEMSVADLMDIWLEKAKLDVRNNTLENYEKMIRVHIKPDLGGYRLKALTPKAVDEWVIGKRKRNLAYNTVDSMLKVLKKALDYAVYPSCYIKDNPARLIKVSKGKKLAEKERRIVSQDEMKKIFERFPFGSGYYIPLMIGYYCGLRIGEVLGLTWEDVNLDTGVLSVNHQLQRVLHNGGKWYLCETKTPTSEREVLMPAILVATLKKWKAQQYANMMKYGQYYKCVYLVKDKDNVGNEIDRLVEQEKILPPIGKEMRMLCTFEYGSHLKQPSFSYTNKIIRDELKIDRFDFHSLRHTSATMLIENGANIKDVSQRLGHASVEITLDTYTHNTKKMQQETVNIIDRIVNVK